MSSFEKVRPGIRPRFFSQKIEAKEPEKKIPSTAAKATTRSPRGEDSRYVMNIRIDQPDTKVQASLREQVYHSLRSCCRSS